VKSHSVTISKILKNYNLCEYCTGRLISKLVGKPSSKSLGKKYLIKYKKTSTTKCYICKNLFENLVFMLSNIYEKSDDVDFKTFNLGIILKNSFLERDDLIKSKFKLKGIENIKFGVSTEIIKKISRRTKSKRIVDNPDLFIQANFKDESCTIRTKPIFVYGRYNKKIRKLPQKQLLCKSCNGIGCHNCNFDGLETLESVESNISNFLIKKFEKNLNGKKAVIVGRSNLNGKPMTQLLLKENCTVTITHSKTKDLKGECLKGDIIVAAVGIPELVKGDWVKKDAIVIDVGINKTEKGLVGDVAFDEVSKVAKALTPVPGGVGPMTIACLLKNTIECFKRSN